MLYYYSEEHQAVDSFEKNNAIKDGHFWDCSRMGRKGGGGKNPCLSYNNEICHSYNLPKKDPKIY